MKLIELDLHPDCVYADNSELVFEIKSNQFSLQDAVARDNSQMPISIIESKPFAIPITVGLKLCKFTSLYYGNSP
jgi:hypothetical protein